MTRIELLKKLLDEANNDVFCYSANYSMTTSKSGYEEKWKTAIEISDLLNQILKDIENLEKYRKESANVRNRASVPGNDDDGEPCEQDCSICPHRICGKKSKKINLSRKQAGEYADEI